MSDRLPFCESQFFQTIDVTRFMPMDRFKARMDELIDQIHQSPKAPGVERIYVAGEIEWDLESARRASGVPLEESVFAALERSAREVGV